MSPKKILPTLRKIDNGVPGRIYELRDPVTLIGRSPECHVRIEDNLISKRHARIIRDKDNRYLLEDLNSRNHTYLDEVQLEPSKPVPLADNSLVRVCDVQFLYRDEPISVVGEDTPNKTSTILGMKDLHTRSKPSAPGAEGDLALRELVEFSRAISGSLHLDAILDKALATLFKAFPQAECGFILLRVEGSDQLVPKALGCSGEAYVTPTISQTILKHVLSDGKAFLTLNALDDSRFNASESVHGSLLRTVMCAPILDRDGQVIGVVQIDTRSMSAQFGTRELDLLGGFASQIGVAIELARLHEIESRHARVEREQRFAREVQLGLLPQERPEPPGYDFWDFYEPARSVGGDYYDYIPLERECGCGECWAIALGDVAGKGLAASLMMARLGSDVRMAVLSEQDAVRMLERLNRRLCDTRLAERHVTLLLLLLDSQRHRLTVLNAGHNYPILRRASGQIEQLGKGSQGTMLGVLADATYEAVEVALEPGDVVLLFTDGVDEAMDPRSDRLTIPRLLSAVSQAPPTVGGLGDHVLKTVRDWAAGQPQSDDIAVICFGRRA
jgi:serine phosphatase RsbU (regulator of sigma subunit)